MDLNFFSDPTLAPKPRHEVQIESLSGQLYPDGLRLAVEIHVSPFLPGDRPNLHIMVSRPTGEILASSTIIESVQSNIRVTIHLPQQSADTNVVLRADLYYDDQKPHTSAVENIVLSEPTS